ncbi:hypothetical protein CHS0354_023658 [Potamilus streckersoni]|uniref:Uncharacterized protein n=1 Tax=Potamilus streckersoni TaxID=2493646 RepID=A0AAE0SY52_9BIVA|nr:hypothetical protein CHS0354_023658 [Potamilus streckersoni]
MAWGTKHHDSLMESYILNDNLTDILTKRMISIKINQVICRIQDVRTYEIIQGSIDLCQDL